MATSQDAPAPVQAALEAAHIDRRRRVVRRLGEKTDSVDMSDLADEMAAAEYGEPVTSKERKRIYVSLYQTHIPALDSLGLVEVERSTVITPTERLEDVAAWIDETRERFGETA